MSFPTLWLCLWPRILLKHWRPKLSHGGMANVSPEWHCSWWDCCHTVLWMLHLSMQTWPPTSLIGNDGGVILAYMYRTVDPVKKLHAGCTSTTLQFHWNFQILRDCLHFTWPHLKWSHSQKVQIYTIKTKEVHAIGSNPFKNKLEDKMQAICYRPFEAKRAERIRRKGASTTGKKKCRHDPKKQTISCRYIRKKNNCR